MHSLRPLNLLTFLMTLAIIYAGCTPAGSGKKSVQSPPPVENFGDYWYQGTAELTRYELRQARYGEIHSGDAVLIFVTEDFLQDKQVKYEHGSREQAVSVLKLNATRKFYTGIYPYSIMTSVFTPVSAMNHSLKVSFSAQEWCGQAFMQLNFQGNDSYRGVLHSYFQDEADQAFAVNNALLEDELWTRIRLNPEALPTGEIDLFPGAHYIRMRHQPLQPQKAVASLSSSEDPALSEKPLQVYRIEYRSIERVLEIKFEAEFPFAIVAWEETYPSGFGDSRVLKTSAVRTHTLNAPYWSLNSVADSLYRKQLGL
ncbi:MAG: septum formation inhibitor Maf [Calditrichaeota bacterium]|nr:septum formation inhibitor Maf [Calditrichota bacterium]